MAALPSRILREDSLDCKANKSWRCLRGYVSRYLNSARVMAPGEGEELVLEPNVGRKHKGDVGDMPGLMGADNMLAREDRLDTLYNEPLRLPDSG